MGFMETLDGYFVGDSVGIDVGLCDGDDVGVLSGIQNKIVSPSGVSIS